LLCADFVKNTGLYARISARIDLDGESVATILLIINLSSAVAGFGAAWLLTESGRFLATDSWGRGTPEETPEEARERSHRSRQLWWGRVLLMTSFALQGASAIVGAFLA
jgi:hypothetical protein